jgi:WD40 repeat protein
LDFGSVSGHAAEVACCSFNKTKSVKSSATLSEAASKLFLASIGLDGTLRFWDAEEGREVSKLVVADGDRVRGSKTVRLEWAGERSVAVGLGYDVFVCALDAKGPTTALEGFVRAIKVRSNGNVVVFYESAKAQCLLASEFAVDAVLALERVFEVATLIPKSREFVVAEKDGRVIAASVLEGGHVDLWQLVELDMPRAIVTK